MTAGVPDTGMPGDHVVAAARAGDEAAFVALYRWLQPRMLRYLVLLSGAAAEDVAAETWTQVCRDLGRFDGGVAAFRAWAFRIARNRATDHARAERRRPAVPVPPEELPEPGRSPMASDEAEEVVATREALALIATLPPDQAEAVLLRAVVGLDAVSAARVLGKRPGAVRMAAHRGLRTLAARLAAPAAGARCDRVDAHPDVRDRTAGLGAVRVS
jgi:RNA polymerase sigma-70 factor (ECF subfamily)